MRSIKSFIPLLFTATAILMFLGLGVWQLERLQWKNTLIAEIAKQQSAPVLTWLPDDITPLPYRTAQLYGTFLNSKALHRIAPPNGPIAGFNVLTPFVMQDKRVILVDRGFGPEDKETKLGGIQRVEGILRPLRRKGIFTPANQLDRNLWFYENLGEMNKATGTELLPLILEATGKQVIGAYPIPSDGQVHLRNDHLGYAITWFALALVAFLMFFFYRRSPGKVL